MPAWFLVSYSAPKVPREEDMASPLWTLRGQRNFSLKPLEDPCLPHLPPVSPAHGCRLVTARGAVLTRPHELPVSCSPWRRTVTVQVRPPLRDILQTQAPTREGAHVALTPSDQASQSIPSGARISQPPLEHVASLRRRPHEPKGTL